MSDPPTLNSVGVHCSRYATIHVPMSNRLRATLAALPRRLWTDYVFTGSIRNTPAKGKRRRPLNQPIGKLGQPFQDVRTSFENACMKAGITNFRFHDLRHTAASHMLMGGVPFRTVGEILGHKTTTMTERYSRLTPEHKRNAVEILSATLQGTEGRGEQRDDVDSVPCVGGTLPVYRSLD